MKQQQIEQINKWNKHK